MFSKIFMEKQKNSAKYYMKKAIEEAYIARAKGELPVGAIIVCKKKIIARAHNLVETLNDATAHAEMLAMSSAFIHLGSRYLGDCTLYSTLEPCFMCGAATQWAQMGGIVYGAADKQRGAHSLAAKMILHPRTNITTSVCSEQCQDLIKNFWSEVRNFF